MIGVGINENVVLIGATVTDKGALSLSFDEEQNLKGDAFDVFDATMSAKVENIGKTEFTVNLFPFKVPSGPKNESKTDGEKLAMVLDDVSKVKNQLHQLLEQYLTNDNITWDPYRGTGVDKTNYQTAILDDSKLALIFENFAKDFIRMATPFFKDANYKLRVKLIRQSKEKHYATIPGKFLLENPWVELMDLPKENSRLAFTKWEKDNGYDNGTPVPKAAADLPEGPAATTAVANPFGNRN